ncbi:MAG: response regulator transcription factor, partial [bacterium]|nr:response regulator transcription factor [bacterium]
VFDMSRVLVADNYPLSRIGMCKIFQTHIPKIEISEASCIGDVMKQLKLKHFNLLVLALSHPGKSNIDVLRNIKLKHPKTPILVICIYPEPLYGCRALSAGASGYITRETPVNDFLVAVKKLLNGELYMSSTLATNMFSKINKRSKINSIELLSNRELQILQLTATGKKIRLIASETNLSVSTIGTYRHRIFTKLDMKSDAELTQFAIDNSLI